jgi:hypothetical protein
LEHPDRRPVNQPADDPVELGCRTGGPVLGELVKGLSQTLHGAGLSAGELIDPFVGEDRGHLVGVGGGNRHQDEPSGPERVIDGELVVHPRLLSPTQSSPRALCLGHGMWALPPWRKERRWWSEAG